MSDADATRWVPSGYTRTEIRVSNSRFIATADCTPTVEAARAFIAQVRAEMPDATHHVYGYVIGHGATTTQGMSDDGEPSGTAGRPVLSIVRGSGLGDVAVVVTRYFGGTLLGTGGLVHAYGDAARAVLAEVVREPKIARESLLVQVSYAAYEQTRRLAAAHNATVEDETFAAEVTLHLVIPAADVPAFSTALIEATAGNAEIVSES